MPRGFDPDAELVAAGVQAVQLLADLPEESAERLRPFVAACRAMHIPRVRCLAAGCATEASGWADLYSLGESGAIAELDALEARWASEDEPHHWQEFEAALELFRTATGMKYPPGTAGEEWREK